MDPRALNFSRRLGLDSLTKICVLFLYRCNSNFWNLCAFRCLQVPIVVDCLFSTVPWKLSSFQPHVLQNKWGHWINSIRVHVIITYYSNLLRKKTIPYHLQSKFPIDPSCAVLLPKLTCINSTEYFNYSISSTHFVTKIYNYMYQFLLYVF